MKDRLKELRRALNISQRELGERIGVKVATVGNWEIGHPVPKTRIYQICKEYNVRREWLETGNGPMFEPTKSERDVVREATLALFRRLDREAQEIVLQSLAEYREAKKAGKKTFKNQANFGTILGDMRQE